MKRKGKKVPRLVIQAKNTCKYNMVTATRCAVFVTPRDTLRTPDPFISSLILGELTHYNMDTPQFHRCQRRLLRCKDTDSDGVLSLAATFLVAFRLDIVRFSHAS